MPDDAQVSTPAPESSTSLVDKISLFGESIARAWRAGKDRARLAEIDKMAKDDAVLARTQLAVEQGERRIKETILPELKRYMDGDLKDAEDAPQKRAELQSRFMQLHNAVERGKKESGLLPLSPAEVVQKSFTQYRNAFQQIANMPGVDTADRRRAEQFLKKVDEFSNASWAEKEGMLKSMNFPLIKEQAQQAPRSALKFLFDNLNRLSASLGNAYSAYIQTATGDLENAVADMTLAAKALNPAENSAKFGEHMLSARKRALVGAGVSGNKLDPELSALLDSQIKKKNDEIIAVLNDESIPEFVQTGTRKMMSTAAKGELREEVEVPVGRYPKKEKIDKIKEGMTGLLIEKFASDLTPAGALGLAISLIDDPANVLKPLKAIGAVTATTSKLAGKGASSASTILGSALSKLPPSVRNTTTLKNIIKALESVPESAIVSTLTGKTPAHSAPIIKHVAQSIDISKGFGTKSPEVADLIQDFAGESNANVRALVKELEPIVADLRPVMEDPELQKRVAYGLAAMQDNTVGAMRNHAEVFDGLREMARRSVPAGITKAKDIEEYAIKYADDFIAKHGFRTARKVLENKAEAEGFKNIIPSYAKGEMPKDTWFLVKDRLPEGLLDDIKISAIKGLSDSPKVQRGLLNLLEHYRKQGSVNESLDIIKSILLNYTPRKWKQLVDEGLPAYAADHNHSVSSFTRHRNFPTWREAAEYYSKRGIELDTDILSTAMRQGLSSARKQATEKFIRGLEKSFDTTRDAFDPELQHLVKRVTEGRDMAVVERMWRKYYLNNFKLTTLFGRAAYAIRNIIDNGVRSYISQGAGKTLDPRSWIEVGRVLTEDGLRGVKLGDDVVKGAQLFHDLLQDGTIKAYTAVTDIGLDAKGIYNFYKSNKSLGRKVWNALPLGPEFSIISENAARVQLALQTIKTEMKAGKSYLEARKIARSVANKTFVSHELSGPVLDAVSNTMPFIRFTAGAAQFYIDALINNPARVNRLGILLNSAESNQFSEEDKKAMLPFVQERLKIMLKKDERGAVTWLTNLGLSLEAINDFISLGQGGVDLARTGQKIIAQVPLLNAMIGLSYNVDPYFGWALDSYRGKKTYKLFYNNETVRNLLGGVDKKVAGVNADGTPKIRYELAKPEVAYKALNLTLPLITNAGLMNALKLITKNSPLARSVGTATVGALLSQPGLATLAQLSDENKTVLEKSLRALTGAKMITEDMPVSKLYRALESMDKANKQLDSAHNEVMSYYESGLSGRPDTKAIWDQYLQVKNARNRQ